MDHERNRRTDRYRHTGLLWQCRAMHYIVHRAVKTIKSNDTESQRIHAR